MQEAFQNRPTFPPVFSLIICTLSVAPCANGKTGAAVNDGRQLPDSALCINLRLPWLLWNILPDGSLIAFYLVVGALLTAGLEFLWAGVPDNAEVRIGTNRAANG